MRNFFKWLVPHWEIREELMGGQPYWMIYHCWLGGAFFFERCNTLASAQVRLHEITGHWL